ncbi:MAG: hypothetical protein K2G96_05365 [Clostridia bacterium]|nr:hypothetical protein [Clostridia bacterium]
MKIASWIFTVLSFLAIPVVFLMCWALKTEDTLTDKLIIGIALFLVLGSVAHILINKYRIKNGGGLFLYIVTFPAYAVPFVAILILWAILSFVNWLCYVFTDRYLVGDFLNWVKREVLGIGVGKSRSVANKTSEKVYTVLDEMGFQRELTLYEQYKEDIVPESPFYGKYYNRFRDDLGNFWRSYDKN